MLSEEQQSSLFSWIGKLACASDSEVSQSIDGSSFQIKCPICDSDCRDNKSSTSGDESRLEEVYTALSNLISVQKNQKNRRPRVAAMLALKRFLSHTSNVNHLNLTTSPFGQWCLQALHSSIRELRIAAGLVDTTSLRGVEANRRSVGALYPVSCRMWQTSKPFQEIVELLLMFCVSFLNRVTSRYKRRAYWLGDSLLGILNTFPARYRN